MIGRLGGIASMATLLAAAPALAQTPPNAAETTSSTQAFEPAYFARYAPNNALDMIQQVPGFTLEEGDTVRGFAGAAGNVLINGNRPSTKTSLSALLSRISAASVIRIELVTGASATLDMRGQTKVANLVVREDALTQPITFDSTLRYTADGRITGSVQASTQRSLFGGQLNISGTYNGLANNGPGGGTFVVGQRVKRNSAGAQTEFAEGFTEQDALLQQINLEYQRELGWATLRLNGGYTITELDGDRFWRSQAPDFNGPVQFLETNTVRNHDETYTVGGDIERKTGAFDFKVITFNKRSQTDNSTRFGLYAPSGALNVATTSKPETESGESILRGQVNWKLSKHHSIEFAAETAYNFLDNITGFVRETPTGITAFFVDGSDTKVEEYRSEFQVSDVWSVTPRLTIEPGFKFEISRIEQDIAYASRPMLHEEREFEYPKPAITATWRIQDGRQLRFSYKREVAQLSFADFVSSVELRDNLTTGGNKDLEPERTWALNLEFEQRFWKGGVVTAFAKHDQVEDVQDFIAVPVRDAGGNPVLNSFGFPTYVDAPGNIGDGERWIFGFRGTLPLERLGLPGARIDATLANGAQYVTDPITGRTREFSDEFIGNWSLAFRQDFPAQKFSYGFRVQDGTAGTAYRYSESSRRSREDPDVQIWVETSRWFGLRIRAGVDDVHSAEFERTRNIYQGGRGVSPLNQVERFYSTNGVQPYIRVSGKF